MTTNVTATPRPNLRPVILLLGLLAASPFLTPATAIGAPAEEAPDPAIVVAARDGDEQRERSLLAEDPAQAADVDRLGLTALDWAALRDHWRISHQLLDAGAPVGIVGFDGGTVLHKACHHDRADLVARLLDAGADLELANQWGRTPLHVAARRGCREVALVLLGRGADVDAPTKEGWTPLHVAYKSGQSDLVAILLAAGADPDRRDEAGERPADLAFIRPARVDLDPAVLDEYIGHYDLGQGVGFKVWLDGGILHLREFAPDELYPIGPDAFYCVQEPWRVDFVRNTAGEITAVDVAFLRQTVRGTRRHEPRYVGAAVCRDCHRRGDGGGPYVTWLASRHAGAYWRLATDWALFLARSQPHYHDLIDPLHDDRCHRCHTTPGQDPDAIVPASFRLEEGIGCEACHGPGSRYIDPEVMGDHAAFVAAGGIVPDERTCRRCHRRPGSLDLAADWPKIAHRLPVHGPVEDGGAHD
ncbi:MAG: ankyrin repeat domain-containing protein [Candidatus Krumholzibacteriia bacterium]